MNKYKNYSRLSNPQLKHKQSEVGYHLYISNEAQKQLDQLSGHTKTRAYQTIQSLASDPYPGRSDGRLCVRTKNDVNYLVAHSIAVKFQRQSEHVLIDAVKSVDKQQAACDFASAGNTIGALQQELRFLESLSNKDAEAIFRMAGLTGDPGLALLGLQQNVRKRLMMLKANGAAKAISDTPLETAAGTTGAVLSTSNVGKISSAGAMAQIWSNYKAAKTLYSVSKLFGNESVTYEGAYSCRQTCKLDITIRE